MNGFEGEVLGPNSIHFPIPVLKRLHEDRQLSNVTGWRHNTEWHIGEEKQDFLRINLRAALAGDMRSGDGWRAGAIFLVPQGVKPADNYSFKYNLRFPEDFNWVKGGKLPGLYGGNAPTGGQIADGYNGFTSRLMWREGGNGEVYLYAPYEENPRLRHSHNDQADGKRWGLNIGRSSWQFDADNSWHTMEQHLKLNTPGQKDGLIRILYDGKEVVVQNGIVIRKTDDLHIDGLVIGSFFGGNDSSWASPVDTYIDFANFELVAKG